MNDTDTPDGTGSLPVSGGAASPAGVPVPPCPPEAPGPASRAPERDEAGPPSAGTARSGDRAGPRGSAATARCLRGCDWTAGPGDPDEIDRAAARHTTKAGHPTTIAAGPRIRGAA